MSRRLRTTTGLLGLMALAMVAAPAFAQTNGQNQAVTEANALYQAGDAEAAYDRLAPMAATMAGNPDFDLALGLAAADSNRPTEALIALQRVLAVQPDNSRARAELARVYAMTGDIDTARAEFDTVVNDPSLPDPVRQRFDRLVRSYDQQIAGGGTNVSGFAELRGGYDTNINAATDDDTIVIPLFAAFGPAQLGAGAQSRESGFIEATAGASVVKPLSRQTRLFASGLGQLRENFEDSQFDQVNLVGTGGIGHTLGNGDVISGSIQLQNIWLSGDSFRFAAGGIAQYTKRLEGGRALSFSAEYFDQDYNNDPLRDSERWGLSASYADRNFIVAVAGGEDNTKNAAADQLSFGYLRANAGIEKRVADNVSVVAGIAGQLRDYKAPDPLFLAERNDEQLDLSAGLKWNVGNDIILRPQLTYTRNWSNFALNDFDRFTASIGVRKEF